MGAEKSRTKGFIYAIVSSSTFGLIPLFSLPVLAAGIQTPTLLSYRYGIGAALIALVMLAMRLNFRITFGQTWRIAILAFFSTAGAITLVEGYPYLSSGAATTIQFSYPVFTCLIMMTFFHERLTWRTAIAIVLAIVGVMGLSGLNPLHMEEFSGMGLFWELLSGLTYAIYLVLVPVLKVDDVESSKLTFYVFLFSVVYLVVWGLLTTGIQPIPSASVGLNLVLLALIPTTISNFTLIAALRHIGSTPTSILGALEPFSAMVVGIFVFQEPFTIVIALSFLCIITSVTLLILKSQQNS